MIPDLPSAPPPPLHPGTHEPVGPDDLAPLFPMALIGQEMTGDSYVDIPGGVLDVYRLWRPSPLFRARRLEAALDTPAKIFYKCEAGSPVGSHKPNTAVPQAFYNHQEGTTKLTTETGAGQWGSRAVVCVRPIRHRVRGVAGRGVLPHQAPPQDDDGDLGGDGALESVGSDRVRTVATGRGSRPPGKPRHRHLRGGVDGGGRSPHPIRAGVGPEPCTAPPDSHRRGSLLQLAKVGEKPDLLVGCTGGGSNFAGLSFPFLREKLKGNMDPTIRCVEPAACPSLTRGEYRYDFGDTAGLTPLVKMHTLGHSFIPDPIHAGGLRYHGMAPLVSHLYETGLVEAESIGQTECFTAALQFARTEGIVPAPEPTHAIAATVREALRCKEAGEEKVILTALCGHGHLDLAAYEDFLSGEMIDYELSDAAIAEALAGVPVLE